MAIISQRKLDGVSAERVRDLFDYDPLTGVLSRKKWRRPINPCRASGYLHVNIDGFNCMVHRVAWLHFHGVWPALYLDHINRVRSDNRIANLREANDLQNVTNRAAQNGRLLKGITRHRGKWQAQIRQGGRNLYLGRYDTAEQAAAIYAAKAEEIHGEYARAP